jgi:predicted GNAT superfamily acetyltransferase
MGELQVELVVDLAGAEAAAALFADVWAPQVPMPTELVRAVAHAGGYAAVVRDGAEVVGASCGLLGLDGEGLLLHSHITGVRDGARDRGVGRLVKAHQRAWAAERGIGRITWTFDLLVRRNVRFNLQVLGARVVAYEPHFYGGMVDGINAGDESDRAVVVWDVVRAEEHAAEARAAAADAEAIGTRVVEADEHGRPVWLDAGAGPWLAALPDDVVVLRRTDPDTALLWRRMQREVVEQARSMGYGVVGVTDTGWLVLAPSPDRAGLPR